MIFLKKPRNFVSHHEGVGCFVEADGKILQLLRANRPGKFESNKWGSPAGGIDAKETPLKAMARELKEEIGLSVLLGQLNFVTKVYVHYKSPYKCKFIYYLFHLLLPYPPEIRLSDEHTASIWIPPHLANTLALVQDQFECIKLVYALY